MTDVVFNTSTSLSPAQFIGINAGAAGAQPGLATAVMPLVPPTRAGGAANVESVATLAARGICPVSTPVISGGVTGAQSILSQLSSGTALMSNIP